jgi:hypothetical protein
MKIVFAALFAVSLGVACSVQLVPPSSSDDVSKMVTSMVIQDESGSCICDADNCNYNGCTCNDGCSSGDACVACCKEICKACGSACIKE